MLQCPVSRGWLRGGWRESNPEEHLPASLTIRFRVQYLTIIAKGRTLSSIST